MIQKYLTRKKNTDRIDPCESIYSTGELERHKFYEEIMQLNVAGYSNRKIAMLLKASRNTVSKVIKSNIVELCRNNRKRLLDKYLAEITTGIREGKTATVIYHELKVGGKNPGSRTNFHEYLDTVAKSLGLKLEKFRHQPVPLPDNTIPEKDFDYLKRTYIFQYLWENQELNESHRQFLLATYPIVIELRKCILEFRQIFIYKNPFLLYLFIDHCSTSSIARLVNFAKGLRQDFEAVENAVTSNLSNGFVEGCNNKIKMVKRVMYGRCSIRLLKAKLIHWPTLNHYG